MPAKIHSACVFGFDCRLIEVEVDILNGPASITIVGLGDASVQESRERIRSAIKNSGFDYPRRKKTINLAPADIRKHGPMFDLPIALGLLSQSEQIPPHCMTDAAAIGELSLNGQLRRVSGILPLVAFLQQQGFKTVIVPQANAKEAGVISGIEIIPATDLQSLVSHLRGEQRIKFAEDKDASAAPDEFGEWHFEDISGHEYAKRALLIAAAGEHNVLLYGPPGSGKTILARSFRTILPPLNFEEALEVTKIYSIAGKLEPGQSLIHKPPFRAAHHTSSMTSLIGGGGIPRPGEISLAHRGVLFLDEFLEFPAATLNCLRQPMEDGTISITRMTMSSSFPAQFTLIAATNPCPCGYYGDPFKTCLCTPSQLAQYRKKLSGPLLDRIDLTVYVPRLPFERISAFAGEETSDLMRKKIMRARQIQFERYYAANRSKGELATSESAASGFAATDSSATGAPYNFGVTCPATTKSGACSAKIRLLNGKIPASNIIEYCNVSEEALGLLKEAFLRFHYSGRVYHRILKVSRTIADLEQSPDIKLHHIAEALQYRPRLGADF